MSRSLWRCRNRECPVPHGAVLGRITADGGLVLSAAVHTFQAFLDTRRAMVGCPACGSVREFRGPAVMAASGGNAGCHPPSGRSSEASSRLAKD
jgi:hypothetical protein